MNVLNRVSDLEYDEMKNYSVISMDGKKYIDIDYIVNFMERSLAYFSDFLEEENNNKRYEKLLMFSRHMDTNKSIVDHIDLADKMNDEDIIQNYSELDRDKKEEQEL